MPFLIEEGVESYGELPLNPFPPVLHHPYPQVNLNLSESEINLKVDVLSICFEVHLSLIFPQCLELFSRQIQTVVSSELLTFISCKSLQLMIPPHPENTKKKPS